MLRSRAVAKENPSISCKTMLIFGIGKGVLTNLLFTSQKSLNPFLPWGVILVLGIHISPNNGLMDMTPNEKLIYYVPPIYFACSIM